MRPIPVCTSDFAQLRADGLLYVDKTAYLHRLICNKGQKFLFLSRPRRFGKSLMLSTLKAIFQGRRELFEGLGISRTDYDWKVHPVIHLNMGFCASENYEQFALSLPHEIARGLAEVGYEYDRNCSYAINFGRAIDTLFANGQSPVVLIDEYDDPVARTLKDVKTAERVRSDLATIYGQLKDRSGKIRFLMVTGVSKFTKMSIFSALSNLSDISFDDEYATMLGFTETELDEYYGEYMAAHAERMKMDAATYRAELKRMYNGYRFGRFVETTVYNPVSINATLSSKYPMFLYGWADTGRPSMLMNFLKRENMLAIDPDQDLMAGARDFDVTDLSDIPVVGLLFQTGYLTIKGFNPQSQLFTLGIPDEEVRIDLAILMASLIGKGSVAWASSIGQHLLCFDWKKFFDGLKSLYAGVAYGPKERHVCEYSYSRCLSFLLQGQGIACQPEAVQADGRADMVCTHPCGIYIFELKVDKPADIAMDQIQRKNYAAPYAADSRPIWLIGLSFDSATRQLIDHKAECLRR